MEILDVPENDASYYRRRSLKERAAQDRSDYMAARIHRAMADRYEALANAAEARVATDSEEHVPKNP